MGLAPLNPISRTVLVNEPGALTEAGRVSKEKVAAVLLGLIALVKVVGPFLGIEAPADTAAVQAALEQSQTIGETFQAGVGWVAVFLGSVWAWSQRDRADKGK